MQTSDLRNKIIRMITEEKEALVSYKGLCARFHIKPDLTPEAVVRSKVEALELLMRDLAISKPLIEK